MQLPETSALLLFYVRTFAATNFFMLLEREIMLSKGKLALQNLKHHVLF